MIVDLKRFISEEQPFWDELEQTVARQENDPDCRMDLEQVRRFHYLYERAMADLAKIQTFASEPELRSYLESLVARAYGEIHEVRGKSYRLRPVRWFFQTFPQTFRRQVRAFRWSAAATAAGMLFGAMALMVDPAAKDVLMPFPHLRIDPSERVAIEEESVGERLRGMKAAFSSQLMTHNTKVSIFTMALGITWGIGTIVMLFYNGVILGAVAFDYLQAGQAKFLFGWLLPHGAIEIPAILLAGQAGFVLGRALIGWGSHDALPVRMRAVGNDVVTLIFGVAILLIWAGFIESFLSQYHEPVIPYAVKIGFGLVELVLLIVFLNWSGKKAEAGAEQ